MMYKPARLFVLLVVSDQLLLSHYCYYCRHCCVYDLLLTSH
jgi:hypothetical protein